MSSRTHIIGIGGIICSTIVISFFTLNPFVHGSSTKVALPIYQARQVDSGLPIRLTIPTIGIDAVIDSVGVTPAGAMDAPEGPDTVAWYELGPRPGEIGSAVIDGHSGWKNNVPAVFDTLHTLQVGDKIYVLDKNGSTVTFIVREIKIYDPKSSAALVFHSNDGKAHLNLITCDGVWNPITRSSSKRLVIFSDKDTEIL